MRHYPTPISSRAIAWALLSQSFWLPLVSIDAHDRWQARVKALTPPTDPAIASGEKPDPLPPTRLATTLPLPSLEEDALGVRREPSSPRTSVEGASTGLLLGGSPGRGQLSIPTPWLGGFKRAVETPVQAVMALASPSRWIPAAAPAPRLKPSPPTNESSARWHGPPIPTSGSDVLLRSFTRSELLGGTLGLRDLDEAPMSTVALAEKARWAGSADPMAPLPALWRDPIRRALGQIPGGGARVEQARVVHVPSRRVTRTTEVPLALQSDGSVDILSRPDNPGVVREIEDWSSRQQAPSRGGVLPAVVLLHPVTDVPSISPAESIPIPIRSEAQSLSQPTTGASTSPAQSPDAPKASPSSWEEVVPSAPSPQPQAVAPASQPIVEAPAPEPEPAAMAADPMPAPVPAVEPVPTP
jgi:hypothetical protein